MESVKRQRRGFLGDGRRCCGALIRLALPLAQFSKFPPQFLDTLLLAGKPLGLVALPSYARLRRGVVVIPTAPGKSDDQYCKRAYRVSP
jgi:hypothetical protein